MLTEQLGPGAGGAPAVQRKEQLGGGAATPADRVVQLLTTRPEEAIAYLATLATSELLAAVNAAADRGHLPLLLAHGSVVTDFRRAQVLAAIYVVELAHAPATDVADARLRRAGPVLDQVPQGQLLQVLEYLLRQRGLSVAASQLIEGTLALREQGENDRPEQPAGAGGGSRADSKTEAQGVGPAAAGMQLPQPIEPGPWAPPGNQWGGFYVGTRRTSGSPTTTRPRTPATWCARTTWRCRTSSVCSRTSSART